MFDVAQIPHAHVPFQPPVGKVLLLANIYNQRKTYCTDLIERTFEGKCLLILHGMIREVFNVLRNILDSI